MNKDHRSGIYRLAMALLSCALIFSPVAARALCIDDGVANYAKVGDPAYGMEQRQEKVGRETVNRDTSLHEGGSTVTDQTVGFWIEYQHPDERAGTFSPGTATGVPSPEMTTMAGFVEHGRSPYNFGSVELKGKSFPMYIPAVREYVHGPSRGGLKKVVLFILAAAITLAFILCFTVAGLVVNDKYTFGKVRQNCFRLDSTFSRKRARNELRRFLQLTFKIFMIIVFYLAVNGVLLFLFQTCSQPARNMIEVYTVDDNQPAEVEEERGSGDWGNDSQFGYLDFSIFILLYFGITFYLFVIKSSRGMFRHYKKHLHGRRYFYNTIDRRRLARSR